MIACPNCGKENPARELYCYACGHILPFELEMKKLNTQAIAPGVYCLSGKAVNLFVLDDAESGVTLVDTGMPGATNRVLTLLRVMGRTPQDVKHILITHADLDHVGSLRGLVKATGASVYASAQTAHYLQKRRSPPHLKMPYKAITAMLDLLFMRANTVDHTVTGDQVLDIAGGIRVIETSGHTPDHVSYFWERERMLFVGDLLRNVNGLALTSPSVTWDMEQARTSARKIPALDPAVMCFGHGDTWTAEDDPDWITHLLPDSLARVSGLRVRHLFFT